MGDFSCCGGPGLVQIRDGKLPVGISNSNNVVVEGQAGPHLFKHYVPWHEQQSELII